MALLASISNKEDKDALQGSVYHFDEASGVQNNDENLHVKET